MCVLAGSLKALLDQQDWVSKHSGPQLGKSAHHKELPSTGLGCHLVPYNNTLSWHLQRVRGTQDLN